VDWAHKNNIDERLIGFLRYRPEHLFEFDSTHNPVAFPSPRTWESIHNRIQIWQIFQVLNKGGDLNTCHFAHTGASSGSKQI
jgi:hypothetical protein